MSDLIDRNEAIDMIEKYFDGLPIAVHYDMLAMIHRLPSAQPERKKGKWVKIGHWGRSYKCNQCGNYLDFDGVNAGRGSTNFCPNCGADMRGEQDG